MSEKSILELIETVEKAHFRTQEDTGANSNAILIWNCVRRFAGLPEIFRSDLPGYCHTHDCYHIIRLDYGCKPRASTTQT